MRKPKKIIPISGPSITEKEISAVSRAAREAWYEGAGKFIAEFEKKFAAYVGVKYALALSSCSAALHLALASLGVGKGDEVIVPDCTWIATAATVRYVGATPVFADIEPDHWCLSPASFKKKITKRTRAVIPVHLYGNPADMGKIAALAKRHDIRVIEDAAQSAGVLYHGRPTGSFGDFSCFSFHGSKIMTTGEGGMLLTDKTDWYERAKFLRGQGQAPGRRFWHTEIGYKYHMSDLQAALGIAQLSRLKQFVQNKRRIFEWYRRRLSDVPGLALNVERAGCLSNYWMMTVVLDKKFGLTKEAVMEKMEAYHVASRPFFYPLSSMPPFAGAKADNPVAYNLSRYAFHLPCGLEIVEEEVDYICKSLTKILEAN